MTLRLLAAAAAVLLVGGTALADPPPAPRDHPDKAEMQRHFAEMCQDRLARTTGELAYLEAKLVLNATQKPLFERWKKVKLAAAQSADCSPPPDGEPGIVDHLKREETMLQARLAELKAEKPALEALVASLSDVQKHAFAPPHPGPHHAGDPHADHRGPGDNEGKPPRLPPPEE